MGRIPIHSMHLLASVVEEGRTYKEVAADLGVSRSTVERRIKGLLRRLHLSNALGSVRADYLDSLPAIRQERETIMAAARAHDEDKLPPPCHVVLDAEEVAAGARAALRSCCRSANRDIALIYTLLCTGLKTMELALLEVGDYLDENGNVRRVSTLRGEVAASGIARPLYFNSTRAVASIDIYLEERLRRRLGTGVPGRFRGLDPKSRLFLTEAGRPFLINPPVTDRFAPHLQVPASDAAPGVRARRMGWHDGTAGPQAGGTLAGSTGCRQGPASGTAWAAVGTPGATAAQAAAHAAGRPRVSRDRVGPIVAADAQEVAMDAAKYFIRGVTLLATDPGLQEALSRVYDSSERPRCMCVRGGVEMYIAKHGEYVVKRMPGTGDMHHPTCQSFEPEPGLSGLGELVGEAIVEHNADHVEIRTDFPFSRVSGKAMPRGEANGEPPAVNAPRKRMSLRAVLHFLYHRAGLNRWYPAMEGRRSQGVIKKYLELAAAGVTLKGETLDKRLYVPEPFRVADKEEIGERRRRKLAMLLSPGDDVAYKMAIVIGQFNGAEQSAYGRKAVGQAHAGRAAVHGEQGLGARRARLCGHPAGP
jgi:hypothetical protein